MKTIAYIFTILLIGFVYYYQINETSSNQGTAAYNELGEVTVNKKDQTQAGYILYPSVGNEEVSIMNPEGKILHRWYVDAQRVRLMPDCSIYVVHGSKTGQKKEHWASLSSTVRRYNWQGNVIWEYYNPQDIHHDIRITANGGIIVPLKAELSANLFRKYRNIPSVIKKIKSDEIIEVNPQGQEVWRWSAHEHLDLSSCGRMDCADVHNESGWTHLNTVFELPENKWFEQGDQRFRPGNIMIMLRNWWQALIIDKETKEVVWSYGGDYRGGLSGGHEAIMIKKGLPGAGNILIFDNGRFYHKGESIVLEINPLTKEIVWKYEDGKRFFSNSAGSAERLPNGNTFISQDTDSSDTGNSRAFEVTPEGEIVWEFQGKLRTARVKKILPGYCEKLG